jgi:hypothetical protein
MAAKKSTATKRKPAATGTLLVPEKLTPLVHYLRHEKVILDSDLAELYGIETGRLNEAVKRNLDRFPEDFMFQLTEDELEALLSQFAIAKDAQSHLRSHTVTLDPASEPLRSQIATSRNADSALRPQSGKATSKGGRRTRPYAFTEQGVAMLSSVLRSPRAVEVNIAIMRTFVQLRRLMDSNALLAEKIEALEEKYAEHDQHFQIVFEAIKQLISSPTPATREIGFHAP